MKKLLYSLSILIASLGFQACNTDVEPTGAVDETIVFTNTKGADGVLEGTWRYLWDTYNSYQNPGWTSLLLASDAMGDDVAVQPNKYGYQAHYSFTNMISTSSATVSQVWTLGYKTIDNMNNVLAKIDNIEGTDSDKKRIKAQAYALRGYIYLNFASFYGLSYENDSTALTVPIYTEPTTKETPGKPKEQLLTVFHQAETDLLTAYNSIGNYARADKKYQIDKNVIAGLLARLYLQTNRWSQAQQYASEAGSGYGWMGKAEYSRGFNDYTNAEWIWGHGQTTEQSTASYSFHFKDVSSKSSYYYSYMADPYFENYFSDSDIRKDMFEYDTTRYIGGLMYKKFLFRSNLTADIVIMRKAEEVLIEAEAYARLNNLSAAIGKLNELRVARLKEGYDATVLPDLAKLTKDELIEEILIERRKELFGEGFSLSDIIRLQKSVERKTIPTGTLVIEDGKPVVIASGDTVKVQGHTVTKFPDGSSFVANSAYYKFAIPAKEITNNPNL